MRILIIYHSGVGNTKQVAKCMKKNIEKNCEVDLYSVENLSSQIEYEKYEGVIIGFPTIHTNPTKRILYFLEEIEKLKQPIPTFIYTTCGLYSANAVRILCKKCKKKNFIPIRGSSYRCKAIDGMLLTPKIKFFQTYEKNIDIRIANECDMFIKDILTQNIVVRIPRFKLYSIINFPNKLAGKLITFPIYLNKDKCISCGICAKNCPANAMKMNKIGFPVFDKEKCEKCYRCIHHCPQYALSLKKKKIPVLVWNDTKL